MMKPNLKQNMAEIIDLFNNKFHSLQMIADIYKVSRQAVKKALNKAGISTTKERSNVLCYCVVCDKELKKTRARKRNQAGWNDYCSKACYYKYIEGAGFPENRTGRRDARFKMANFFIGTMKLPLGTVVHHIDGNQENNSASNLMLFVSQSAHIRFHRATPVEPSDIIFDGSIDSPEHRAAAREKVYTMLGQRF